ncbi:MAG: hypothetical protein UX86_C0039G0002 [Candidatus Amesbacteria bacterium GW2011_GWC1_47_15]|uniref:Uncharacterized protein n=1 Tax=Candidatus Amesbacteria bacterium GW2011_GWC1_47_15 TaxID=1618364 RepID=A0A0G1UZ09_9BACT|nr:MAG: hypothetical protein UX86_C0039G0002 [Candidatus Amesbacteria bacterium GW2011_GWC1_47_15]
MQLTLPLVTSAAILDSINPCAISVLFLTIGFLLSLNKSRPQIVVIAGAYILGIFFTYVLIGLGVLQALTLFGIPRAISKFGAGILLVTGFINLLDHYIPDFPVKLGIPAFSKPSIARLMQQATLPAVFFMGVLVGLFEFPCTGGPYLLILTLLHDQGTFAKGAFYLIYYNLIFVSPLVVILALASTPAVLTRFEAWRKTNSASLNLWTAIGMIVLGIIIFLL